MELTRVYQNPKSPRAHLLGELQSPNSFDRALCGLEPEWPNLWMGTGSQDEIEHAEDLDVCGRCAAEALKRSRRDGLTRA